VPGEYSSVLEKLHYLQFKQQWFWYVLLNNLLFHGLIPLFLLLARFYIWLEHVFIKIANFQH
jgi:hypothetical protein